MLIYYFRLLIYNVFLKNHYFPFIYPFLNICRKFPKMSMGIAYNVPGIRRLGQVIGLCEANVPCPKCGGVKPCRGRKPEHGFAEPEPPNRRRSVYRLLYEVWAYTFIQFYSLICLSYMYNHLFYVLLLSMNLIMENLFRLLILFLYPIYCLFLY